jgi:hypothetical protein
VTYYVLTRVDRDLLLALATYRILTIKQAVRLGIAGREHVGERFCTLEGWGLVKILNQPRMNGPRYHWLTPDGVNVVMELPVDDDEEQRPTPILPRKKDFKIGAHLRQREGIVDWHNYGVGRESMARGWIGSRRSLTQTPTDWAKPSPLGPKTWPMRSSTSSTMDGVSWLLALEMETGGETERLDNFSGRLLNRLNVFASHVPEKALNWPNKSKMARLLFVFPSAAMMERAKKLRPLPGSDVWKRVHFNALPSVVEDFSKGWWQAGAPPSPSQAHRWLTVRVLWLSGSLCSSIPLKALLWASYRLEESRGFAPPLFSLPIFQKSFFLNSWNL